MMAFLGLPSLKTFKRFFPHVDKIEDPNASQTIRLLWDRVHDLEARMQRCETFNQLAAAAHNTNEAAIAAAKTAADAALALVQVPGEAATSGTPGGGPTPPGPAPGDPGSQTNPIVAMSIDPAAIAASVRSSLQFYGIGFNPAIDNYWIGLASSPAQFSNGKWYQGWNRYWEVRANPSNTGSADPALGSEPAQH